MPTVLIAEDDPVFRRVLRFTVGRAGWQVEAVGDGGSALDRLRRGGIDFLVTDHQMPVLSGVELITTMAQDDHLASVPTVLCTAKGFEMDLGRLQERFNLAGVMHKPFSPKRLCDIIESRLTDSLAMAAQGSGSA